MTEPKKEWIKRQAEKGRKTLETDIQLKLVLDGAATCKFETDIPFFGHMLDHLCRHSGMDLSGYLKGDMEIDCHHSVEDAGILLGSLLAESLGDKRGIARYGHCTLPMDDVLVTVAIDLGGRYHFKYSGPDSINEGKFGVYDAELTLEFLQKFALNARMNLHVLVHCGENRHHLHEALFKALGRAIRMAAERDEVLDAGIPSTKGVLE